MQPAEAVALYVKDKRRKRRDELAFYIAQPSFEKAIIASVLSQRNDRRESHQRRIPARALRRSADRLCQNANSLRKARSFEELHGLINYLLTSRSKKIRGIGPLTVYDVAIRIAARKGLEPEHVYLHAGARVGASRVGAPNWRTGSISKSELPAEFDELSEAECENCLCIYFAKKKRRRSRSPC
jgi:hypothetical protein